jgi:uncharacterized protein (DUF433 family)
MAREERSSQARKFHASFIDAEPIPLTIDSDGVIRVAQTRVTLDTVVQAFADGATAEEIVGQYPSLNLADVYAVISYILRHRADVDSYLEKRQKQADAVHKENESRFSAQGIRERLAARRRPEN